MAYAGLLIEGFDHFVIGDIGKKWAGEFSGNGSIISGRLGGSAIRYSSAGLRGRLDPTGGSATYTKPLVGIALRTSAYNATDPLFSLDSGLANTQNGNCDVRITAGGLLQLTRAGTTIATGTNVLSLNTWYYIEAKILIASDATGSYELRVNGVTELGPTSSVQTSSSATVDVLRLDTAGTSGNQDYDDIVVQDWSVAGVDFIGDARVATLLANAAGNYSQFTPLSSTNISNVDDTTADGDTTYNSDSTSGHKDSFAMGNLPTSGVPYIVQVTSEIRKDDSGSRTLRQFLRSGSTDYEGQSWSVTDTYQFRRDIWNSNPAGGVWDQTAVNALEAGYKVHA